MWNKTFGTLQDRKTQLNGVIWQILIYLDDNTGIFHVFEMQIEMNEFDHHIIFSAA